MRAALLLFLLAGLASAFSIDSYYAHATVTPYGSLQVYENINFTLDQEYNEGFRSIRKEDFGSLDDIVMQSVKVNGQAVPFEKAMNGDQAEIIWKKTSVGLNDVELEYTIRDRAELYNDFAKVCYEHYGANWPVEAKMFSSRMTLPEASRGKEMHFQIYSAKEGDAYVDDLSIAVEMTDVPPGNYVGGCYLYDKGALNTSRTVDASALELLQEERELYGSKTVLEEEDPAGMLLLCLPAGLLVLIVAAVLHVTSPKLERLPESILPPGKEEPAVVSAVLRNKVDDGAMMAATILGLINRNVLDMVELEKREGGEKERSILMLKHMPDKPKAYEKALLDMLFPGGRKEIDLDQMAEEYNKIRSRETAKKSPVAAGVKRFKEGIDDLLDKRGLEGLSRRLDEKLGIIAGVGVFSSFFLCCFATVVPEAMMESFARGDYAAVAGFLVSGGMLVLGVGLLIKDYLKPEIRPGMEDEYSRWDAFRRGVEASRLKEYPPSSAVIWGEILVYATALGMADKVKRHLSELDSLTARRMERMEKVGSSSVRFYAAALAVHNLKTYGTRGGRRSGGFSSRSSGGWSSGGGGFSGGSSGGGGFR